MKEQRRDFLKKTGLLGLAALGKSLFGNVDPSALKQFENTLQEKEAFVLPDLPYANDALEPFIDKETMAIHHGKHHKAYVDNLNKALQSHTGPKTLKDLFENASKLSPAIRNNSGGHYNHSLFWTIMNTPSSNSSNEAEGELLTALKTHFISTEQFRKEFSEQALKIFGSGWCWLVLSPEKQLKVCVTANQDNPLMDLSPIKGTPILALDVWEHAYYLKYQNKRADYIQNWWKLVNWKKAEQLYKDALKG
jgi:Fe-Mn family superoxide dismutase